MKYLTILLLAIMSSVPRLNAQTDAIVKYFDKYLEDDRFTAVYISPKLFEMVSKLDLKDLGDIEESEARMAMEVLDQLKGLRVLTTENSPMEFYKEAIGKIKVDDYDLLMSVRDEGENVRFWTKSQGDIINELLLLVGGSDEFVLLSLVGNIDLSKIASLAKAIDVEGMEHLEKIKKSDEKN